MTQIFHIYLFYAVLYIVELYVYQFIILADMFLVGTAMLIFGMGLYVMFVGTKTMKEKGSGLSGSNFFGLFYLKVNLSEQFQSIYVCVSLVNVFVTSINYMISVSYFSQYQHGLGCNLFLKPKRKSAML